MLGALRTTAVRATPLASAPVKAFECVTPYRVWRDQAMRAGTSVGFVPTMGALHAGHLSLVDASLRENDTTVVSIFVNPAQFAPHEDLSSYPRTLTSDLAQLAACEERASAPGRLVALVPQVRDMYPNGITQDVARQVGAFVEVAGLSHQMEGLTRPTFFRGVATVVTKLFNIVQPDRAYFGQKDIQQAILIRRLADDLLFRYPHGAAGIRVLPTARDPHDHLALSSRNAYLDSAGRAAAPLLYRSLEAGKHAWEAGVASGMPSAERVQATLATARGVMAKGAAALDAQSGEHASVELDYISLNDPATLEELGGAAAGDAAIFSGAMYVRNRSSDKRPAARLIDNLLLNFSLS